MDKSYEFVTSRDTNDLYTSNVYIALITENFCDDATCYAQLKVAADRQMPCYVLIKQGTIIPADYQALIKSANVVWTKEFNENNIDQITSQMRKELMKDEYA